MKRVLTALIALSLVVTGCDLLDSAKAALEFTFGNGQGIKPIQASYTVDIPQDFKCGSPIQQQGYSVATKLNGTNCEFTFHQEITAMGADAYTGAQATTLKGVKSVKRLEVTTTKLAVSNAATGAALDVATAITDLNAKVFGQIVLAKAEVAKLPSTKALSGEPLDKLKALILAQQPVVLPVDVFVSLPLDPKPPEKLRVDFEGQPGFVVGL